MSTHLINDSIHNTTTSKNINNYQLMHYALHPSKFKMF